ncbi:Rab GTPase activator and protein kinase, putative [Plasmodium vinckei vinckei]|uniref:Rab GTPase activator and protein kinase, putative n=1 Tax=Plasmodium vinckei vinckei TaxID=54757 RepID=A0A081ID53_PLAVN|nr:Rab GTPase activator and protein kinase, putative [Plasmodium vinckei vinckei]KEG01611.1 serine/threonine protein kinase [Plasmodium vinckei vinckei]VEV55594.1 Rab GTPase activator and protein kinase, putative [Plasmodium vinckei vinckei]
MDNYMNKFFDRCKSSEFLLGVQKYSLYGKEDKIIQNGESNVKNSVKQNEYNLIASKFEKIKKLHHPNICRYININRKNNDYYIFSEYYSLSLYDLLNGEKKNRAHFKCLRKIFRIKNQTSNTKLSKMCENVNEKTDDQTKIINHMVLKKIIYEILKAVEYLHSKNIHFLNITPHNILITSKGKIKLHNYCMSYLFDDYEYNSEKKDKEFFNKKLFIDQIMSMENQLNNMKNNQRCNNLSDLSENDEGNMLGSPLASFNDKKIESEKKKKKFIFIKNYFKYYNFSEDMLYFGPFFIFLNLFENQKIKISYNLYKHIDIFSVGIVIIQIINGLIDLQFIIDIFFSNFFCSKVSEIINSEQTRSTKINNQGGDSHFEQNKEKEMYIRKYNKINKIYESFKIVKNVLEQCVDEKGEKVEKVEKNMTGSEKNMIGSEKNMTKSEKNDEHRQLKFFVSSLLKKTDSINKIENIFILLLYIKIYYTYIGYYSDSKIRENKSRKKNISLININIYRLFENGYAKKNVMKRGSRLNVEYERQNIYKNKKRSNIMYKIIKNMMKHLLKHNIDISCIKVIENIYTEFFSINILEQNVKQIFLPSMKNEKIYFFNFLHKCLLLTYNDFNANSLLSHYYFFEREMVSLNSISQFEVGYNENIKSNKNRQGLTYKHYHNSLMSYYIYCTKDENNKLKDKYYINKKNIFYWFDLLYKYNYEEELTNADFFETPCNILKLPYMFYKKNDKYFKVSLFSMYKEYILKKYAQLFNKYEYVDKWKADVVEKKNKLRWLKLQKNKETDQDCTKYIREIPVTCFSLLKKKRKQIRHTKWDIINSGIAQIRRRNKNNNINVEKQTNLKIDKEKNKSYTYESDSSAFSNFLNIPNDIKEEEFRFKNINIKTVGIYLDSFYEIIKDAYIFIKNNENIFCSYKNQYNDICVYSRNYIFIHQYRLYIHFQKMLKLESTNNIKLIREVKSGFPSIIRNIIYLVFLNYNYTILKQKSFEKNQKLKTQIIMLCQYITGIPSKYKLLYSKYNNNYSCNIILKSDIKVEGKDNCLDMSVDEKKKIVVKKNFFFSNRLKHENDLIGSIKFQRKIFGMLLLLRNKLKVTSRFLKYLVVPITVLYYDNLYLNYKCLQKIIKNYLLDIYTNKYSLFEFIYILNTLLNYYIPELAKFFYKNNINITNIIKSWILSLYCNFFDIQNSFLLLDFILIQPRSCLLFISISILSYLKKYILKSSKSKIYQDIFTLSHLINLNYIIRMSQHLYKTCSTLFTTFPSHTQNHQTPFSTNIEINNNNYNIKNDSKYNNHINCLSYFMNKQEWSKYYVHRHTFGVYKKVIKKERGCSKYCNYSYSKKNKSDEKNDMSYCDMKEEKNVNAINISDKKKCNNMVKCGEKTKSAKIGKYYENFLMCYRANKHKNLNEYVSYEKKGSYLKCYKQNEEITKKIHSVNNGCYKSEYTISNKVSLYYSITSIKKKNKIKLKNIDMIKIIGFPMFPFFYITNLSNESSLDQYIIVDTRPVENFMTKRFKNSVHVNAFFTNFKKGIYKNYVNDDEKGYDSDYYDDHTLNNYELKSNLKTIILVFSDAIFDFDIIHNFLNLEIMFVTILRGGFEYAINNLPSNYFT